MSGSGGFYKYRCKNFYSHNCPNWVWVNNSPCATCIAEGKDNEAEVLSSWTSSKDIVVPRVRNGVLQYTLMEIVASNEPGEGWTLKDKDVSNRPPPALSVTSAMPGSHGAGAEWN
ncbi:hypothetical protein PT974_02592 [Cladobotryum mycophilum]|uniref:Uncharacterized protein n=1 Tax=Cladobotryum mycophilum TaxID=491253 RepID=A0ABR0SYK8_9HYPO